MIGVWGSVLLLGFKREGLLFKREEKKRREEGGEDSDKCMNE